MEEEVFASNRRYAAEAIEKIGGPAAAARALSTEEKPVVLAVVWAWVNRDKRGVPLEHLAKIEELSGVQRERLRQDVPWR